MGKELCGFYATDLYCFAEDKDGFSGMFLIHKDGQGRLWLLYLFDTGLNSVRNVTGMLMLTLERAFKNYAPDTKIIIPCSNKKVAALAAAYLK